MKTYLITGGAGFIGSNYIEYLTNEYSDKIEIINVDLLTYAGTLDNLLFTKNSKNYHFFNRNICDREFINHLFIKYDIDYVINFAAESHVDRSIESATSFIETNVVGTEVLLEAAKRHWIKSGVCLPDKKFIQISTDEVYGPIEVGFVDEVEHLNPTNPYAASKASADLLVKSFHKTFGLPCIITRCTNNYGKRQHEEKFIPTIITSILERKPIPVYGEGKQKRDWLHVTDHVTAIQKVLLEGNIGEIYNIGVCNDVTNIDLVNKIIDYMKVQLHTKDLDELITFVDDRLGHDVRYGLNANKLKNELSWEPTVSFDEGLSQTIDWYINKHKNNKDLSDKNGSEI